MDDCWRVMHALPGDGQNRPSVGDSLIEVQERYNTLSNIQAETYEYGIPPIYADPQVLDFDALANQTAEPAAHYPARARPGMSLADGFFQPAPAQVPPDMLRHQQDLIGPIAQFLTGLFPAVFGGEMENVKTASGYAMARDQALGRLGLVWRRLKHFYGDVMLLSVDCFRKNRPNDVEIPFLGAGGAVRGEIHSPRRSEGQYSGASGIGRDVPAAEIAAARRAAATDEQSRSDDSGGAARAGESRVHQVADRPERTGGAGRRRAQQAAARNSATLLAAGPLWSKLPVPGTSAWRQLLAGHERRARLACSPCSIHRPGGRAAGRSRDGIRGVPPLGQFRCRADRARAESRRASPTCARTPQNTPPHWRGSRHRLL